MPRQAVDEIGGNLDGVDHLALGKARVSVDAVERHRHGIRGKGFDLDLAARTGLLASSLDRIFGPEGRWPIEEGQPQSVESGGGKCPST